MTRTMRCSSPINKVPQYWIVLHLNLTCQSQIHTGPKCRSWIKFQSTNDPKIFLQIEQWGFFSWTQTDFASTVEHKWCNLLPCYSHFTWNLHLKDDKAFKIKPNRPAGSVSPLQPFHPVASPSATTPPAWTSGRSWPGWRPKSSLSLRWETKLVTSPSTPARMVTTPCERRQGVLSRSTLFLLSCSSRFFKFDHVALTVLLSSTSCCCSIKLQF